MSISCDRDAPCKNVFFIQAILERSETEMKQRFHNQLEKAEREIALLKKKLETEMEQRHALSKNQDVSSRRKRNVPLCGINYF